MTWAKVKNFVFGGGAALLFVVFMGYVEWRVDVAVADALSAQDLGTDAKIVSMDTNIAANKSLSEENKEDITLTQQQLIDIANILMRPPE